MQVLIAISGFCPRIGNVPCTTPFDLLFVISIHVPTWGTTLSISTNLFALIFQSTFPRGERLIPLVTHVKSQVISIHVPSWGTTLDGWKKSCADVKFQSTFPRGERHESSDTGPLPFKFQSTFPRGERHGRGSGCTLRSYFNPRSLVGNDAPVISTTKFFEISIHVPSWGTTNFRTKKRNSSLYFNPRSLVGNDGLMLRTSSGKVYFNPRSLVGNDQSGFSCNEQIQHFNPRSLVGNDYIAEKQSLIEKHFNPRSLVGNDTSFFLPYFPPCIFQSTFPRGERHTTASMALERGIFQSTFPRGERR